MKNDSQRSHLVVAGVYKYFGGFAALEDVSFQVDPGEFVSILGPSGCGKTTILRVVAGLDEPTCGKVYLGGRDVSGWPVAKRNVGIVFQNYALFPNLTAARNVAYGLENRKAGRGEIRAKVKALLELVGLSGQEDKYPAQLSGGQQQRVALARAMALDPDLLLLDEPLSALDAKVRLRLRGEIRDLQRRLGVTTIMVTHDQEEALTMADRILVMNRGEIVQYGTPHEIYNHPATPFVASFIGSMNFLEGAAVVGEDRLQVGGMLLWGEVCGQLPSAQDAVVAIRPEDVLINPNGDAGPNLLRAEIQSCEYRGSHYRVRCALLLGPGKRHSLVAEVSTEKFHRLGLRDGLRVMVDLPPEKLHVFSADKLDKVA